jgi:hypothetical protein
MLLSPELVSELLLESQLQLKPELKPELKPSWNDPYARCPSARIHRWNVRLLKYALAHSRRGNPE